MQKIRYLLAVFFFMVLGSNGKKFNLQYFLCSFNVPCDIFTPILEEMIVFSNV